MHRMRKWRAKHPVQAAWHAHLWNAKQRGIAVEWTFAEFEQFCRETNYHVTRREGMTIERKRATLGYSLDNCAVLPHQINSEKGSRIDRWMVAKFGRRVVA